MKYPTLFLLLSISFSVSAQSWCGSVKPADYQHNLSPSERANLAVQSPRSGTDWIAVWYHIIAKDDGSGAVDLKNIIVGHCELNGIYNPFNIGFYIAGIDTIKDTNLWEYQSGWLGYNAFSAHNVSKKCNVYVNGNLPGLCGFATYPGTGPSGGGIFLNAACVGANQTTYAHEMGHYLNLPHTFDDENGVEYVNGSNCAWAGDGFCDTPADFLDERTPCPYNGNQTDPNGDLYRNVIDETLYMSYFNDACTNRFSPMEIAEMQTALTKNSRSVLLGQPLPDLNPLPLPAWVSPASGDTTMVAGSIPFRWAAVPGAVFYRFTLQGKNSAVPVVDILTKNTFYTTGNLSPNKEYQYKITAISYGNTCESSAPFSLIKTSTLKTNPNIITASCNGSNDASITINPTSGQAPYTIEWSNGSTSTTVMNLEPGTYSVTITDNRGEVGVAEIVVNDPAPLTTSINKTGNNLKADATGGTPPYVYEWSNGVYDQINANVNSTNYTVSVTDSRGCLSVQTFSPLTSIGVNSNIDATIKVFPNPVSQTEMLNVQVSLNERSEGFVNLVSMNGEVMEQVKTTFAPGANNVQLDVSKLSAGIYLVQLKTAAGVKAQRVSIMH